RKILTSLIMSQSIKLLRPDEHPSEPLLDIVQSYNAPTLAAIEQHFLSVRGYMNSRIVSGCEAFVAVFFILAIGIQLGAQQSQYSQNDIDNGAKIYTSQCSTCHGPNGDQTGGADLGSNKFRRAASDDDLKALIKSGITDAGMPPHDFTPAQLASLVA